MWSFRNAVEEAGLYEGDAARARQWYEKLADEVDAACRTGLDCTAPRSTLQPLLRWELARPFARSLVEGLLLVGGLRDLRTTQAASPAGEEALRRFESLTNSPIPRFLVRVKGVATMVGGPPELALLGPGAQAPAEVWRQPIPPAHDQRGDGRFAARFVVETACAGGCALGVMAGPRIEAEVAIQPGMGSVSTSRATWSTESVEFRELTPVPPLRALRLRILDGISDGYEAIAPVALLAALFLLALRTAGSPWSGKLDHAATIVATAFLLAVVVRLGLLALIDVTSVRAVVVHYCTPAYPLYIGAVAIILLADGGKTPGSGSARLGRRRQSLV